jgi:outer membrane protein assembly factor BamB
VGFAVDGFPIYGERGRGGKLLHDSDLDACHGSVDVVKVGHKRRHVYRYHLTREFPYTVGCLRGARRSSLAIAAVASTQPSSSQGGAQDGGAPKITANPALFPGFDEGTSDYVVRCSDSTPVVLSVEANPGTLVAVNGQPGRSGSFSVPVGLVANRAFAFTVTRGGATHAYHVRCLPSDFTTWTVSRPGTPQLGYFIASENPSGVPGYIAIYDDRGVPLWWHRDDPQPVAGELLSNGDLVWTLFTFPSAWSGDFEERRLDGTLVNRWRTVGPNPGYADLHDFLELPNGHVMLISYPTRDHVDLTSIGGPADATVQDGEIQELDANGSLVWSWNTHGHIDTSESARWPELWSGPPKPVYDIIHMNSIDDQGGKVVFSARALDAVYEIDKATGQIDWKLGGTTTAQSLNIAGDPPATQEFSSGHPELGTKDFFGQHDARMSPDGHTLTLHDNGTMHGGNAGRPPRALRFSLDFTPYVFKATKVEDVSDPSAVPSSFCCGSARKLAGGDWFMSWGASNRIEELTPAGAPVLALTFPGGYNSYRAFPIARGRLDADAVRHGMDVMSGGP